MFISYANPNNKSQHLFRERNKPKNQPDLQFCNNDNFNVVNLRSSTPQPRNVTAHQFLNYVSDESSPTTRTRKVTNTTLSSENSPPLAGRHDLPNHGWEEQAQDFLLRCSDALKANCELSSSQATAAANAFLKAAKKTGTNLSATTLLQAHFSFCKGAIDRILVDDPLDDNVCAVGNSANAPKQHLSNMEVVPSTVSHLQHLDEVRFLRSVVKNLVLQLRVGTPQQGQPSSVVPADGPEFPHQQQLQRRVPSKVEFCAPRPVEVVDDDDSEAVSLLTWADPSPRSRLVGIPTDIVPLSHSVPPPRAVVCSPPSYTILPSLSWGIGTPRKDSLSSITSQNYYLETTQLLLTCKALCQQPAKILLLEPGEVGHDRARGMKVQLVLQNAYIRGSYNGSLHQGVPHGSGVLRFDNRDLYIGEFLNGFMHGQGTLFCRSHNNRKLAVYRGEYWHNEFWGGTSCYNHHRDDTGRSAGAA
jgi:hypothetical protein